MDAEDKSNDTGTPWAEPLAPDENADAVLDQDENTDTTGRDESANAPGRDESADVSGRDGNTDVPGRDENTDTTGRDESAGALDQGEDAETPDGDGRPDPARERERRREADELRRRVAALAQQPPRSLREAVHRAAHRPTAEADTAGDDAASAAVGDAWHCAAMTTTTELTLFADYFQLHVSDAVADGDLSDAWTDQAVADQLAVARHALGIGTAVNVDVSVTVVVLPQEPGDDSSEFDHVVEAGLDVPSGRLAVQGGTDYAPDAATFEVPPGWNRVRVSRSNLARATEADVDSDESPETTERVRIQVWPAPESPAKIIKRWSQPDDESDA
ncbi:MULTISPECIES: hypothetical protein [Streptomyces]|nr:MULTISPECIES: hypothetical protein [Streptomyces]